MTTLLALVLPAAAGNPTHAAAEAADWAVVTTATHKDAGEVTVWKSTVAGVECFRGTAATDVPASKLLDVVADVEGATRWSSAGVTEAKLLSRSGDRLEYYQYLDVPGWTMSADRYWFLQSTIERAGPKLAFRWSPLSSDSSFAAHRAEFQAAHSDAVEPPVNIGGWYFEEESGKSAITYLVCTLPGGSIPASIQAAATRKTLPDTVGDVVREARRR